MLSVNDEHTVGADKMHIYGVSLTIFRDENVQPFSLIFGLMRMIKKFRGLLKKSTDCTRHIKMILAQYPSKQSTATFVRQSRPSLGTCKISG